MQIVNSVEDLGIALASETGVIGIFSIEMKNDGGFHAGHLYLLQQAQAMCDVVVVSASFNTIFFMEYLFGDEDPFFMDSPLPTYDLNDETYMINKLTNNNIDYYFPLIYTTTILDGWFTGSESVVNLKSEVDSIIVSEGYDTNYINPLWIYTLRMLLISRLLFYRKNWYSIDKRFCAWKDGLTRFYEKDFCTKYTNFDLQILDVINKVDTNIPLDDFIHNLAFDSPILTKLKSVYRDVENNLDIISEAKIQNRIPLVDPNWTADNIIIISEGVIGTTNMFIEFDIRENSKTYRFQNLYKGVI